MTNITPTQSRSIEDPSLNQENTRSHSSREDATQAVALRNFKNFQIQYGTEYPLHAAIGRWDSRNAIALINNLHVDINAREPNNQGEYDGCTSRTPLEKVLTCGPIQREVALALLEKDELDVNESKIIHPLALFFNAFICCYTGNNAENNQLRLENIPVLEAILRHPNFKFSQENFKQLLDSIDPSFEKLQPKKDMLRVFVQNNLIFNFFLGQFEEHIKKETLKSEIKTFVCHFINDFELYLIESNTSSDKAELSMLRSEIQNDPIKYGRINNLLAKVKQIILTESTRINTRILKLLQMRELNLDTSRNIKVRLERLMKEDEKNKIELLIIEKGINTFSRN